MEIKDKSIDVFLEELASKSATPGGGSAAAVMGAQAAALVSMVCHLTIGKPKYALVEAEMQTLLQQAEVLRHELVGMIKSDVDVFNQVMAAYGLGKETEEQKTLRSAAIQEALKAATEVPLTCAKACAEVIALSKVAAEKGSTAVISDAGVAVMAGYAGLKSAALNVYVNTGNLKDTAFAQAKLVQLEHILDGAGLTTEEVYQVVKNKL
jgi:formiminotetrahydrofolate cyclodeaminase